MLAKFAYPHGSLHPSLVGVGASSRSPDQLQGCSLLCQLRLSPKDNSLPLLRAPFCADPASSRTAHGQFSPAEYKGPREESFVMQSHMPWTDAREPHSHLRELVAVGAGGS